jgi:hypothetical protein
MSPAAGARRRENKQKILESLSSGSLSMLHLCYIYGDGDHMFAVVRTICPLRGSAV